MKKDLMFIFFKYLIHNTPLRQRTSNLIYHDQKDYIKFFIPCRPAKRCKQANRVENI